MENWAHAFEAIGDNCEFGFMQQQKGVDEGALLKWCRIMAYQDLLTFLKAPQAVFYQRENLSPTSDDMLCDASSGILYHTVLYSREKDGERHFIAQGEEFDRVYAAELEKKTYMYNKFFDGLRGAKKIYVFKMNGTNDVAMATEIGTCLAAFNPQNRLLYVTDQDPERIGTVEKLNDNTYRGYIQALAPYFPATDAKLEYWELMCAETLRLMRA